jgi:hypothetical protein
MILSLLRFRDELDGDIVAALEVSLRRYLHPSFETNLERGAAKAHNVTKCVLARLSKDGRDAEVELLQEYTGTPDFG